jgi:hypothetical protein
VGLVARVADNIKTLRKALDDADFTGTPVREAGRGEVVITLVFRCHTELAACRCTSRFTAEASSPAFVFSSTQYQYPLSCVNGHLQARMHWWAKACRRHTSCTS